MVRVMVGFRVIGLDSDCVVRVRLGFRYRVLGCRKRT